MIKIVVSLTEHPTCARSQKYGALPAATSDAGLKRDILRKCQRDLLNGTQPSFCVCNESVGFGHHFCWTQWSIACHKTLTAYFEIALCSVELARMQTWQIFW